MPAPMNSPADPYRFEPRADGVAALVPDHAASRAWARQQEAAERAEAARRSQPAWRRALDRVRGAA